MYFEVYIRNKHFRIFRNTKSKIVFFDRNANLK